MGFDYLGGRRWAEVTRDERFFCQALYQHILDEGADRFVRHLVDDHGLDADPSGEWEVGYEVCFYRDLWQHRGRPGRLFSPKRTFDLCLFGQREILIVEAKAAQPFDLDQCRVFERDLDEVRRLTSVNNVHLLGLCASACPVSPAVAAVFTGPVLRWDALARRYGDDPVLRRADAVYQPPRTGAHRSGESLLALAQAGGTGWVGRKGGLGGAAFRGDAASGGWRSRTYAFDPDAAAAPSANWFSLEQFCQAVTAAGR